MGVVWMIHSDHAGYELEFFSVDGHTLDVVTVGAAQVGPVNRPDVMHGRATPESA